MTVCPRISAQVLGLAGAPAEVVTMAYGDEARHRGEAACAMGPNGKARLTITLAAHATDHRGSSSCDPRE